MDRLRLSRRADAIWMALHQFAFRHYGRVRFREGQLLLLPGLVGDEAGGAPVSALELAGKRRSGDRGVVPLEPGPRRAVSKRQERRLAERRQRQAPDVESEVRAGRFGGARL